MLRVSNLEGVLLRRCLIFRDLNLEGVVLRGCIILKGCYFV